MLKNAVLCAAGVAMLLDAPAAQAQTQNQLSPPGRKLMQITALIVAANVCKVAITPETATRMNEATDSLGNEQKDMTQEQYNAGMQAMTENMTANKATVCPQLEKTDIDGAVAEILD